MKKKEIKIALGEPGVGVRFAPLDKFTEVQPENFKSLRSAEESRLLRQLVHAGIVFPVAVTAGKRDMLLIQDGVHRIRALRRLAAAGWEVPEIPYVLVQTKTAKDAQVGVLIGSARYGVVTAKSLALFAGRGDSKHPVARYYNFPRLPIQDIEAEEDENVFVLHYKFAPDQYKRLQKVLRLLREQTREKDEQIVLSALQMVEKGEVV